MNSVDLRMVAKWVVFLLIFLPVVVASGRAVFTSKMKARGLILVLTLFLLGAVLRLALSESWVGAALIWVIAIATGAYFARGIRISEGFRQKWGVASIPVVYLGCMASCMAPPGLGYFATAIFTMPVPAK